MNRAVRSGFLPVAGRSTRSRGRRLLFTTGLILAVLVMGCRRTSEDWVDDLVHGDEFERRMAVTALREVDDAEVFRAVKALLAALQDRDSQVSDAAAESLRILSPRGVDSILDTLRRIQGRKKGKRLFCVELLGDLGPDADPLLLSALCDPDDAARNSVAEAFVRRGPTAIAQARAALAESGAAPPPALRQDD